MNKRIKISETKKCHIKQLSDRLIVYISEFLTDLNMPKVTKIMNNNRDNKNSPVYCIRNIHVFKDIINMSTIFPQCNSYYKKVNEPLKLKYYLHKNSAKFADVRLLARQYGIWKSEDIHLITYPNKRLITELRYKGYSIDMPSLTSVYPISGDISCGRHGYHMIKFIDKDIFDSMNAEIKLSISSEKYDYCLPNELRLKISEFICPGEYQIILFDIKSLPLLILDQEISMKVCKDKYSFYHVDKYILIKFDITLDMFKNTINTIEKRIVFPV